MWAGGMLAPQCEGVTADPVITRLGAEAADAWSAITPVTRRGTLVLALERDRRNWPALRAAPRRIITLATAPIWNQTCSPGPA